MTEYNTFDSLSTCPAVIPYYGAELASTLIVAQNSPLDMLFYYDLRLAMMNGVITRAKNWFSGEPLHGFYAMKSFGDLYRLENQVKTEGTDKEIYILGASNGTESALMLSCRDYEGEVEISVKGLDKLSVIVSESTYDNIAFNNTEVAIKDGKIRFNAKKDTIYYVK